MTANEFLIHGLEATFWVTALTLLALALRGPVTQRFGSRAAMLLWLMPALRLIAPTLTKKVEVAAAVPAKPPVTNYEPSSWIVPATTEPTVQVAEAAKPEQTFYATSDPAAQMVYAYAPAEVTTPEATQTPILASIWEIGSTFMTAEYLASLVLSLWFLGALMAFALCFSKAARWRNTLIAEATDVPEPLAKKAEAAAERAGATKPFTLMLSGAAETPQLMGLGKPILALPLDFQERYNEEEQEMALLHELTHLRRRDLSVLMASEAAFALQWFNPLTPTARKALRADQEAACDEAVRGLGVNTKSYAALLLKAASLGRPLPALTLDHSLKERLIRMQNPLNAPLKRYAFILTAGVSALAVAGFTASSTTVTTVAQETAEPAPKRRADNSAETDDSWERFLSASESNRADADERWAEYVARVEADARGGRTVTDQEWEEFRADARSARQEHSQRQREQQQRVREQQQRVREQQQRVREQAQREREQSQRVREQAQREREQAQRLRERAQRLREEERREIEAERRQVLRLEFPDRGESGENGTEPRIRFERMIAEAREGLEGLGREGSSNFIRFFGNDEGDDVQIEADEVRIIRREVDGDSGKQIIELKVGDEDSEPVIIELDGDESTENIFSFRTNEGDGDNIIFRLDEDADRSFFIPEGQTSESVFVLRESADHDVRIETHGSGDHDFRWFSSDDNMSMVLLGNPFEGIVEPSFEPPTPPEVTIEPPVIERKETDEGTWILIPNEPDMSAFEEAMEGFEAQMEEFEEVMEEWGERMGEAGETVGELAEKCAEHVEDSDRPKIIGMRVPGTRKKVRALCVRGDEERLASDEVRALIDRSELSGDERERYEEALRDH